MVFQTDYDEIELQKISYDVIAITSPKCFQFGPPKQNFWATTVIVE